MPILDTHISGEQLRMPRQVDAGKPFRQIGAVAQKVGEIDQVFQNAEDKNALDSATLQAKGALLDLEAQDKANPIANDKNWYSEESSEIVDSGAGEVPPHLQGAYRANMFLPTKKSNIASKARRRTAVSAQGKAILGQELKMVAGLPQEERQPQISKLLTTAGTFKFIDAAGATEGYVSAWGNAAEVDASSFDVNGEPRFDEVMDKVADLNDPTYPLETEDRTNLHAKLKKQKKMVMGQRADAATSAFVDIMADKMSKDIPLDENDAMQFKGVIPPKELKGLLRIVAQSKKDVVSEARAGTRFEQSQLSYWRAEGARLDSILDLPENAELKQQFEDGTLSPDNIKDNPNIADDVKKQLVTISSEVERLQKFEKFDTDREVAVGNLTADLDKYNYDALVTKLSTDSHLKTLETPAKEKILADHKRIISEGQGFRQSKNWQTSYDQLLAFHDNMGFVSGVPDTTDQRVMDKAVLKENREFAQAQKNFLERSEWSFREYKKNPTGDEPNYYQIGEQEIRPFRVQQEEGAVRKFIKDVFTLPVTKYMAGKEASIGEQAIQEQTQAFESSTESQQFNQYMAEKEQIAQGLVDNTVNPKQKQDQFTVGQEIEQGGKKYKYLGNDAWQPLN